MNREHAYNNIMGITDFDNLGLWFEPIADTSPTTLKRHLFKMWS